MPDPTIPTSQCAGELLERQACLWSNDRTLLPNYKQKRSMCTDGGRPKEGLQQLFLIICKSTAGIILFCLCSPSSPRETLGALYQDLHWWRFLFRRPVEMAQEWWATTLADIMQMGLLHLFKKKRLKADGQCKVSEEQCQTASLCLWGYVSLSKANRGRVWWMITENNADIHCATYTRQCLYKVWDEDTSFDTAAVITFSELINSC